MKNTVKTWTARLTPILMLAPPMVWGGDIRLLVRADDMGVARAVNQACIEAATNGIVRSVEVIVPGPWFLHAVKLIRQAPGLDVGVHLCLTSEWEDVKWRPLTHAPSLVDSNGYFYPMTSQRPDWPPGTGFLQSGFKLEEVERELRAQIEMARRHLPGVTHLSSHMGAATATPELREVTRRLSDEYGLPDRPEGLRGTRAWSGGQTSIDERLNAFVAMVESLEPGDWLFVEHPARNVPEMRAVFHQGYENVALDREGVFQVFTSPLAREAIRRRNIQLISYGDLIRGK